MNEKEIAEKHGVSTESIQAQLRIGLAIEKEHYVDMAHRRKIALDHLEEIPDYYTRLKQMEEKAKYETDESAVPAKKKGFPPVKAEPKDTDDERSDKAFAMVSGAAKAAPEAGEVEEAEEYSPEVTVECSTDHSYSVGQSVKLNAVVASISENASGKHEVKFKVTGF